MGRLARHVFVCTNLRAEDNPKGSCARRGGKELADALRRATHAAGLKRVVRVNEAECLDQCAHGATLVVYPEGVWYGGVEIADVPELLREHLRDGCPLARLRIPEAELNGRGLSVAEGWSGEP